MAVCSFNPFIGRWLEDRTMSLSERFNADIISVESPKCFSCKHYTGDLYCHAFPDGISHQYDSVCRNANCFVQQSQLVSLRTSCRTLLSTTSHCLLRGGKSLLSSRHGQPTRRTFPITAAW